MVVVVTHVVGNHFPTNVFCVAMQSTSSFFPVLLAACVASFTREIEKLSCDWLFYHWTQKLESNNPVIIMASFFAFKFYGFSIVVCQGRYFSERSGHSRSFIGSYPAVKMPNVTVAICLLICYRKCGKSSRP